MNPSSQQPKVILITGASSGIGEATARHLAQLGHAVVLGARRTERIDRIASEIIAAGGEAVSFPLDVTDFDSVKAFVANALEKLQRIDVLVNNAGVMPLSFIADLRVAEWNQMIDVNLRGVLYGIAAVVPIMQQQNHGHIINIASVSAYRVDPTAAVYCATKYAVRALSEGLRQENRDIRVTVVSPGVTQTELFESVAVPSVKAMFDDMVKNTSIPAHAVAETVAFAIVQPGHVDINELVVRPTAQG